MAFIHTQLFYLPEIDQRHKVIISCLRRSENMKFKHRNTRVFDKCKMQHKYKSGQSLYTNTPAGTTMAESRNSLLINFVRIFLWEQFLLIFKL